MFHYVLLTHVLTRIILERRVRLKVSELTQILSEYGCFLVGHGASHDKWQSSINGKIFFVPRHPSRDVKEGTLHNILKQAGIKK